MTNDITPRSFWSFPSFRIPSILDMENEENEWMTIPGFSNGLTIAEDEAKVYISASLPGVKQDDVDITFDKGNLWIKGEVKEIENDPKKYYRKASNTFSYRVRVPGELDQNLEPEAIYENGVMTIAFSKVPKSPPKKIQIKSK